MNRRDFIKLSMGFAGLTTLPPFSAAIAQSKAVFKASDVQPPGYPTVAATENLGKKLAAATNGRLSIQVYPSAQLGGEKETIEQTQIGAIQMLRVSANANANLVALCWMNSGARSIYNSRKPISTVEDVKGLKIRVIGNPIFI